MCKQVFIVKLHQAENQCQLDDYHDLNNNLLIDIRLPIDKEG